LLGEIFKSRGIFKTVLRYFTLAWNNAMYVTSLYSFGDIILSQDQSLSDWWDSGLARTLWYGMCQRWGLAGDRPQTSLTAVRDGRLHRVIVPHQVTLRCVFIVGVSKFLQLFSSTCLGQRLRWKTETELNLFIFAQTENLGIFLLSLSY
jgi:hypothetical protein